MQPIIQYLLTAMKLQLDEHTKHRQQNSSVQQNPNSITLPKAIKHAEATTSIQKICHANKCHLVLAKGIIRKPMLCAKS